MIAYATFGVRDLAASRAFFVPVLAALGYEVFYENETHVGFAQGGNPANPGNIWLGHPFNGAEAVAANGAMIGLTAPSRAAVRAFHETALAQGGTCEGLPGIRADYGPNVYMAYVRDPIGNKFSAICSAESE